MTNNFKFTAVLSLLLVIFSAAAFAESPSTEQCAATDTYSPFVLDPVADSILLTAGIGSSGVVYLVDKFTPAQNGSALTFSWDEVNSFDRAISQFLCPDGFNKPLHKVADFSAGFQLLTPFFVFGAEAIFSNLPPMELVTIGTMYVEAFTLSYGLKNIIKMSVARTRPYMYYDNTNGADVESNDWHYSFPSGHTTNAFLGAGFTTYVFSKYYPDSVWKIPVIAATYTIATATGVLRIMSGNHFATDVLAGAALGTICGYGVPMLHAFIAEHRHEIAEDDTVVAKLLDGMTITPYGVSFSLYL